MFDFEILTGQPATTEESVEGPRPSEATDEVAISDPSLLQPLGMVVEDGVILPAPPYVLRVTRTTTCRYVDSPSNYLVEAFGNCVTVLVMRQCTVVTVTEVSISDLGPWVVANTVTKKHGELRMLTLCDGVVTKDEAPPEDWLPPDEEDEDSGAETDGDHGDSHDTGDDSGGDDTDDAAGDDDASGDDGAASDGTGDDHAADETAEEREQRIRHATVRRIVEDEEPHPDRPPADVGSPQPPPTTGGDDGRPLWRPNPIIVDTQHGYSERYDEGDAIVVKWSCWILTNVTRVGCWWIAHYSAFVITFRIDRETGAITRSVEPDARPPATSPQEIPGCKEAELAIRTGVVSRAIGARVSLHGRLHMVVPGERVIVVVRNSGGDQLRRDVVVPDDGGRFELAFDVESYADADNALLIEARAREDTVEAVGEAYLRPTSREPRDMLVRRVPVIVEDVPGLTLPGDVSP